MTDTKDYCTIGNCPCACIAAKVATVDQGIDPRKLPELWAEIGQLIATKARCSRTVIDPCQVEINREILLGLIELFEKVVGVLAAFNAAKLEK